MTYSTSVMQLFQEGFCRVVVLDDRPRMKANLSRQTWAEHMSNCNALFEV